jgi:hypothetical protein
MPSFTSGSHNPALSFHWVWEVIGSKYIIMMHMSGADNPADT